MYVGTPTVASLRWLIRRDGEIVQVSDLGAVYGFAVRGELLETDELFDPRDGEWHRAGDVADVAQRIAAGEAVDRIKSTLPKHRAKAGNIPIPAIAHLTEVCVRAATAILGWFLKVAIVVTVIFLIVKGLKWIWYF
jgi:hypothetical protein